MRRNFEDTFALYQALSNKAELVMFEVPETAMDELG